MRAEYGITMVMPKSLKDWAGRPSVQEPLPKITAPRDMVFVDHLHASRRQAGLHHDIRVGDPATGRTWSWATKKGLPPPGRAHELFGTGFHPWKYLSFQGPLTGYGQGTVKIDRKETAKVLASGPGKMQIALIEGRAPETFTISQRDGRWYMHNTTPSRKTQIWDRLIPLERPKYREQPANSVDLEDVGSVMEPKIDGASVLVALRAGKQPEVLSTRASKTAPGGFIRHTFKLPQLVGQKAPQEADTALRAEIYGVDKSTGRVIPARELGGILNAKTPKSLKMQQEKGVELRLMPFDVMRYRGRDMGAKPYMDRLKAIRELAGRLPYLQAPETAETPEDKARLLQEIREGRHPLTREGAVLWDKETGRPTKLKLKPDFDVTVKSVFPSKNPLYGGGFTYLFNGAEGRVGTGLSGALRRDILKHPAKYKGLIARVQAQEVFPSGKLRAPAFKGWHLDKNDPERLRGIKTATLKTHLQPYQQRVVERMKQQPGLVVAHGLGSGKTLTSIAAQEALGLPAEVVVPAALGANYMKEVRKHTAGKGPKRGIRSLQRLARSRAQMTTPMLIVDEAHRMRDPKTSTRAALGSVRAAKRMLLTASPFYNKPSDIAPLVNVAAGARILPEIPKEFENRYVENKKLRPGLWGWLRGVRPGSVQVMRGGSRGELGRVLSKWVDYHPSASKNYPSVSRETVEVPMSKKQMKIYSTLMGTAPFWVRYKIKKGLPPSKSEAKRLNAFLSGTRQVSNTTAPFTRGGEVEEPKIEAAFKKLRHTLRANPRSKALVYSNFIGSGLDRYKTRLEKAGIPYGEFTGRMPRRTRNRMVQDYNAGKLRALLVSSAGGEGLDLKGTRLVQLLDPHWNMEKLKQVEGRAIRYKSHAGLPRGQRNVKVQQFLSTRPRTGLLERWHLKKPGGSVDQYLYGMSAKKENLIRQFRSLLVEPPPAKIQ